jgi:EmrB/QacA subfamily drug resistance transporter
MSTRAEEAVLPQNDPRRWVTLAIVILAAFIVVLDNSVLYVAIPTILREFDTTLASLQWVVTGYALTFASLLIIGGRLGDVYGHRRIFIIGAALFGAGSLLASVSTGVPELILGEAIIEGIGASLMLPATLAILSSTFRGRERGTAFAAWGATAGFGSAFGPVVGGILTTEYSWRWAFRINVVVAPIAVIGALLFMPRGFRGERRLGIDVPGALLVASGMFLLVFGLSEAGTYGWVVAKSSFTVGGVTVWPGSWPVSIVPVAFALAAVLLVAFVAHELSRERKGGTPLFEFSLLRIRSLRWGLLTRMVLAMGQLSLIFVLPVFLQEGKGLSAEQNGFWLLPSGLFVIAGARFGSKLIHRYGATVVVRFGLIAEAIGIGYIALVVRPGLSFPELLPGFLLYGIGIGCAAAQLTNVVLEHVPSVKAGVVSGANATANQVGSALGVAVIGAILTARTISRASAEISTAAIPSAVKSEAVSRVHSLGTNFAAPHGLSNRDVDVLHRVLADAVANGARIALLFAMGVVALGALISFLIPRHEPAPADAATATADDFDAFEPIEPGFAH